MTRSMLTISAFATAVTGEAATAGVEGSSAAGCQRGAGDGEPSGTRNPTGYPAVRFVSAGAA
ncbi:hypothetical protein SAMN05192554_10445 [Haloarchaeobius iranensis]|uniref:Uncharacterized protein n=1 Tax=Haloarchaeobius iranensis TaxID=996166 RepID=A0A1G9UC14_9EURY|nr:hypothetical protein SAMN05192554_10445 [Haloarchaeobius iranensis]